MKSVAALSLLVAILTGVGAGLYASRQPRRRWPVLLLGALVFAAGVAMMLAARGDGSALVVWVGRRGRDNLHVLDDVSGSAEALLILRSDLAFAGFGVLVGFIGETISSWRHGRARNRD